MLTYYISGVDNNPIRIFICEDSKGPSQNEWQLFVAQRWQMDSQTIEDEIAKRFPGLKAIPMIGASCFGPPFFDGKGNLMEDFQYPSGILYKNDGGTTSYIKYSDSEIIWCDWDDFVYIGQDNLDIQGNKIESFIGWQGISTQYGFLVPRSDILVQRMPEEIILKAHKVYPSMYPKLIGRYESIFGYIFIDGKWIKLLSIIRDQFLFKSLEIIEFVGGY